MSSILLECGSQKEDSLPQNLEIRNIVMSGKVAKSTHYGRGQSSEKVNRGNACDSVSEGFGNTGNSEVQKWNMKMPKYPEI